MAEFKDEATSVAVGRKESVGAKIKEWGRKKIVALKRRPQNIPFVALIITSFTYLIALNILSQGPVKDLPGAPWLGFCVFANTLFSILILALYLNIFPKYPKVNKKTGKKTKTNYVMLVLVFVFIAILITCDIIYYIISLSHIAVSVSLFFCTIEQAEAFSAYWSESFASNPVLNITYYRENLVAAMEFSITHLVMVCVSAVLLATLPLYKKLIMKINTSKELESTQLSEAIDVEDGD